MSTVTSSTARRAPRSWRSVWLAAGVLLLIGAAIYLIKGREILLYAQLAYASFVADKFYADYAGLTKNIAYGPLPDEKLDVYQPQTPGKHPVVIFVHGGGWRNYSKEMHAPVAQKLIPQDLVVVLPEYTRTAGTTYRQQTAETASAIAWTLENIARFGGDPARVFVSGQSAGAHLTALALLDRQWLAAVHHSSGEVAGFIGIAGPYDIDAQMAFERSHGGTGPVLVEVFEGEANFPNGSPSHFVRADLPPVLLIHGDADDTVPLRISQDFQAQLVSAGASSKLLVYPGAGHSGLLFDALVTNPARLITDITDFVHASRPAGAVQQ